MQDFLDMGSRLVLLLIPGILLLLYGRRLFWLLGGLLTGIAALATLSYFLQPEVVDFGFGLQGFTLVFEEVPNLPSILIGAAIAFILGMILTVRFPRAACGVVGFVVGAIIVFSNLELFAVDWPEPVRRTLILLGGGGLAFVGIRNQDQTMIFISTFVAVAMILQGLGLNRDEPLIAILWLVLMLTGMIFQTNNLRVQQLKVAAARSEDTSTMSSSMEESRA